MSIPKYRCDNCNTRLVLWCKAVGMAPHRDTCQHTLMICKKGCNVARDASAEAEPVATLP